jgi:hypothetical protein
MDDCLVKNIAIALLALLLAGCAAQPSGNHNFSIAPVGSKQGNWPLRNLAAHGRIEVTGYLLADSGRAARVVFKFGVNDIGFSLAELALSDESCNGAYTMALSHRVKAKSSTTDYLSSKLRWEAPLQLQAEWWGDGRFTLTVDGLESKTIKLDKPINDLAVEAYYGSIRVDNLVYTNLTNP